jgi:SAM-dependent methyltransferase
MYDQIVEYYDLIHEEFTADIAYIVRLAAQNKQQVLELGCGTGRLLLPLARTGHSVVGIDSSATMLAMARKKILEESKPVQDRIEILNMDMSELSLGRQFGLIIFPHNTLMHLNRRQLNKTLNKIKGHLLVGGCLFIDVDNPVEVADPEDDSLVLLERTLHDEVGRRTILQFSSSRVDNRQQVRQVTWIFDESPDEGGELKRTVVETALHYYLSHELILSLETSGLKVRSQLGDYDLRPYDEDSPRLLIEATKI